MTISTGVRLHKTHTGERHRRPADGSCPETNKIHSILSTTFLAAAAGHQQQTDKKSLIVGGFAFVLFIFFIFFFAPFF